MLFFFSFLFFLIDSVFFSSVKAYHRLHHTGFSPVLCASRETSLEDVTYRIVLWKKRHFLDNSKKIKQQSGQLSRWTSKTFSLAAIKVLESHYVFKHSLIFVIYFSSPDHNTKRNFNETEAGSSLINSYRRELNLSRINCTFSSLIQTSFSLKMLLLSESWSPFH